MYGLFQISDKAEHFPLTGHRGQFPFLELSYS